MFGFTVKDDYITLSAYTLAEMLLVLLIISIVLISVPLSTKKLFTVKEVRSFHGRYECYWDDSSGTNKLKYYYEQERAGMGNQVQEGELTGDKCEFTIPMNYPYIMIHAVGGGGAGGNLTETVASPTLDTAYYDYLPGEDGLWSKWFVQFMNEVRSNSALKTKYHIEENPETVNTKTVYPTNLILKQATLKYRKNGNAGQVSSMFFPFIPAGKKFYLYPGKGGELKAENENGENGENTVVQIISSGSTCDKNNQNAACNIIFAKGGTGAIVLGSDGMPINLSTVIQLHGGKKSDYGISNYSDVRENSSGFREIIDQVNKNTGTLISHIPLNAGDGGNGANQYVKDSTTGLIVHEFDNYEGSIAGTQGANWISISKHILPSIYNDGSGTCSKQTSGIETAYSGQIWIKRTKYNVSTQWYPYPSGYSPSYYYCAVGNMDRGSPTLACKATGRCANYQYSNTGELLSSTGNTGLYRNPNIHINSLTPENTYFEIEERINKHFDPDTNSDKDTNYISCAADSGYDYTSTPCASLNTNFDSSKGICKATKGKNGAIVILW